MSKYIAPGVYVRERDFSLYVPNLSTTICGMVGTATKGPVNEPTLITNVPQFIRTFGNPSPAHYAPYAALQFLRRGTQLWFVRVAGTDSVIATASFNAYRPAHVVSTDADQSFTIVTDTDDTLRIVVTDERTNPITTYDSEVTLAAGTYTAAEMAAEIKSKIEAVPGLALLATAVVHDSKLKIVAKAASPLVKLRIEAPAANGAETALGLPVGSLADATAVTIDNVGTPGTETVDYYVVAKNGTGVSVATAQTTTSAAVLDGTNFNTVNFTAPADATSIDIYRTYSAVTVKIASDLAATATSFDDQGAIQLGTGTDTPLPVDTEPVGVLAGTFGLEATSEGSHGNYLSVQIFQKDGFLFDVNVYEGTPASEYGYLVEVHKGVSLDDTSTKWIGTVLGTPAETGSSALVNLTTSPADTLAAGDDLILPEAKTTAFTGGDDGLASVLAGDYIGISSPVKTGLQLFRSPQELDLNLILIPGITTPAVINETIAICEERADCMAIIDTPDNYSPQQVVDWHNGFGAFGDHQAFNSSYAAMYWPWIQIYDAYNNAEVWTPPSGHMAAVYAWTDYIADTWWAPAGFNRGHITSGINTRYRPDTGEIEHLYGNQNAINPVVKFPKDGIVVWGQRTLQRKPSALDRVNVRRLFLYAEKVIATAVKYLLFEPNDPATWRSFIRLVNPFLESIKQRRGLYDFRVICDETTNTPDLIDQNVMKGVILLKPTKAAEYIVIDFAATSTGAKFDELSDLIY